MHKLSEVKCRLNLVISSKWHNGEMFKMDIQVRNGPPDVSKPISHHKLLHYRFLIDITVNNYNLTRSLKGGVHVSPNMKRSVLAGKEGFCNRKIARASVTKLTRQEDL